MMHIFNLALAVVSTAFLLDCTTVGSRAEEMQQVATAPGDAKTETDLAARGQQLYAHHCSHCHGFDMVNVGTIAFDLRKFPHGDKSRFVNSVTNGKNNRMPPWGDLLTKEEIDCLWAYISSYPQP